MTETNIETIQIQASKISKKEYVIDNTRKKNHVNLWLDSYDNLFSDFDPRPYSQRSLSDDFLNEAQKISSEIKSESFEIIFLVPRNKRNQHLQDIIKIRLHSHFKKNYTELKKNKNALIKKGILLALLGTLLMFGATAISLLQTSQLLINFLLVVLEPAGWFTAWYGMDHIFYTSKDEADHLTFNEKMSKADIKFDTY